MNNLKALKYQTNKQSLEAAKKEFYGRRYRISTFDSVFNLDKLNLIPGSDRVRKSNFGKKTYSQKPVINPMLKNN